MVKAEEEFNYTLTRDEAKQCLTCCEQVKLYKESIDYTSLDHPPQWYNTTSALVVFTIVAGVLGYSMGKAK